nr:putative zinc finger, CCHC-type [Tanacetum cinerariifolium]
MVFSVASHKEKGSSSNTTPTILIFDLPEEIVETIRHLTFEKRAKLCYNMFLTILLKNHGLCIKGLRFHPDNPFFNIFHIHDLWRFPKEALCFFYYLFESFIIGITFNAEKLLSYVVKSQFKDVPPPHSRHLLTMLQWFIPHHQWTKWLTTIVKGTYVLVMFRRPGSFLPPKAVNDDRFVVYHAPYCFIHDWYKVNPSSRRSSISIVLTGISCDPKPLPQSYTHTRSPSLNIWALEQRRLKPSARKEPTLLQESQSIPDVVTLTKTPDVLLIQKENPNQETPIEFPKSDIKQYFTFNDIPPSKWHERSIKMLTWCTAELQYYTIDVVIKRFLTRLQGHLRDWYHTLGEYRQLQIQQSISPEAFMSIIYSEFIGSPWEHTTHAREEFLKMKCCSFQMKDLEKHYDRMSKRFYCLNRVDDVNLKQVFLNSFLESLRNEAYRALEARNVTIAQTTLAKYDEPSDSVLCTLAYSDLSSDDDSDTDSPESDSDFGVHMINLISHVLPIQEDLPLPLAKIHLLTDAFAKPIPVIAFFDTADDKFPLPQKKSLFQHLAEARVLSKFDLKSGFWQLETSDDNDDARSLWSSDDDEHFDPFKDDLTNPDVHWSP